MPTGPQRNPFPTAEEMGSQAVGDSSKVAATSTPSAVSSVQFEPQMTGVVNGETGRAMNSVTAHMAPGATGSVVQEYKQPGSADKDPTHFWAETRSVPGPNPTPAAARNIAANQVSAVLTNMSSQWGVTNPRKLATLDAPGAYANAPYKPSNPAPKPATFTKTRAATPAMPTDASNLTGAYSTRAATPETARAVTRAQHQADPHNWRGIARDLGNAGAPEFRAARTGTAASTAAKDWVSSRYTGAYSGRTPYATQQRNDASNYTGAFSGRAAAPVAVKAAANRIAANNKLAASGLSAKPTKPQRPAPTRRNGPR